MDYKFEEFKGNATPDGFNYPVDVYYGTIYLGTLIAKADGYVIAQVATPTAKTKISPSRNNKFRTKEIAAEVLHRTWKSIRYGGDDLGSTVPAISEIALATQTPKPSLEPIDGPHLLIPDYETKGDKYPGDIKPGYYEPKQLVLLLLAHLHQPDALQFIADMMETGLPDKDVFIKWLRKNKSNPKALQRAAQDWKKFI